MLLLTIYLTSLVHHLASVGLCPHRAQRQLGAKTGGRDEKKKKRKFYVFVLQLKVNMHGIVCAKTSASATMNVVKIKLTAPSS